MLRRILPVSCTVARGAWPALAGAVRHGHHALTHHDFTSALSRRLTEEEEEMMRLQQERRTVSAVVPGKLFMRHWIAAEQSTVSVVNRVLSGIITVCIMIWACGFSTLGYNGHNCAHLSGWAFIAFFWVLHTHLMFLPLLFGTLAMMQLLFN